MLFEHPEGWLNSLTTDMSIRPPRFRIKGTKVGIRKVGPMPGLNEHVTFVLTNQTTCCSLAGVVTW